MIRALKNYAVFKGRAARSEYWEFTLSTLAIFAAMATVPFFAFRQATQTGEIALLLNALPLYFLIPVVFLVLIVPMFSVTVRRLHDLGRSGWWIFVILVLSVILLAIPLVGWLMSLLFLPVACAVFSDRGTEGDNRYGPDPLASAMSPPSLPEQPAAKS